MHTTGKVQVSIDTESSLIQIILLTIHTNYRFTPGGAGKYVMVQFKC